MAALAQPDVMETIVREVVSTISLPEGVRFERLEFRENSNGDPAVFVVYSVAKSPKPDEERAKELSILMTATVRPIHKLGLPLSPYPLFVTT
jgi:hypothetical protein